MQLCDNGLTVHFAERVKGDYSWLLGFDEIRAFLHKVISTVQESDPRFWYLLELGHQTLFYDPEADFPYHAYEEMHITENIAGVLLKGVAFAKYHNIYVGDCPAVLSLMDPPKLDPIQLMDHYVGKSAREIVESMGQEDMYVYCYEWCWMTFFGHEPMIDQIKLIALSEGLPITEKVSFSDR